MSELKKWLTNIKNSYTVFYKNIANVEKIQNKILFNILKNNANTEFGIKHDFISIKNIAEFKSKVPISEYEDYEEYIENIKNHKEKILSSEKVMFLKSTSGSSSKNKLIPYTVSLKNEFTKSLNV